MITIGDRDKIIDGLNKIKEMIGSGTFVWRKDREDVHMNIEAALTDMIGEPAKKLHTARSRNDQVVTDLRLWCRDAIDRILTRIKQLQVHQNDLFLKVELLMENGKFKIIYITGCIMHSQIHLLQFFLEHLRNSHKRMYSYNYI